MDDLFIRRTYIMHGLMESNLTEAGLFGGVGARLATGIRRFGSNLASRGKDMAGRAGPAPVGDATETFGNSVRRMGGQAMQSMGGQIQKRPGLTGGLAVGGAATGAYAAGRRRGRNSGPGGRMR